MSTYTAIADAGQTIVNLLRAQMSPEPLRNPEHIGLCDPKERGSFVLGMHLFNIAENGEMRDHNPITLADGRLQNPPLSLQISYIFSVASKSEVAARGIDEHRILGSLAQVLHDFARLPAEYMPESLRAANETLRVSMMPLQLDDKVKIWSMFNEAYRPSLFYMVEPVLIESAITREPAPRVLNAALGVDKRG